MTDTRINKRWNELLSGASPSNSTPEEAKNSTPEEERLAIRPAFTEAA